MKRPIEYLEVEDCDKGIEIPVESDPIRCNGIYCGSCSYNISSGTLYRCRRYGGSLKVILVDWGDNIEVVRLKRCLENSGHLHLLDKYIRERISYMPISEFRKFGYLQELNRRFLHPLGLALEVIVSDEGEEKLGGIWDYRDAAEGIYYNYADMSVSSVECIQEARVKKDNIDNELDSRAQSRMDVLGFIIEPI